MKQSNTDYRHTYHFNGFSKRDEANSPSIYHEPDINTKIKENPYKTNVEIEKDEIVLRPDLSALHKAGGKKHSQGGTGVYLPDDSFIFSDDKDLKFTDKDYKLFELKEGGKKEKQNTPAKVVEKNVDMKHYNSLMTILQDPYKDKVAKDSASMMLDKYFKTLGNIAYVQEAKKEFPQGVPDISHGTAPVYDADLKDNIEENKQYMKYGGYTMQSGGSIDRYTGKLPPYPNQFTNYYDRKQKQKYSAPSWINPSEFYGTPGLVDYMKTLDHINGVDNDLKKPDDAQWGYRHQAALEKFFPNGMKLPIPKDNTIGALPPGSDKLDNPFLTDTTTRITPGDVTGNAQNGVPVNWKFTPFQKQSQLYNGLKWAGVSREMPLRSRYTATYTDPVLLNPEQDIADMKGAAYQQMQGADLYSPILAQAQKADAYSQLLNRTPQVRTQYDNQNVDIKNRYGLVNNQIKNEETMRNSANDQQYWKESAIGRQNFRNMRGYMADQWMNNRNQDIQDNQSLAYQMLTLGPKPAYGYDFNSGNFYRNDKNILDVQSNNNYREDLVAIADQLRQKGYSEALIGNIIKSKAFQTSQPSPQLYKKGGRFNPYK
jgi:hypothetical protein